jgi:hypothetical protein
MGEPTMACEIRTTTVEQVSEVEFMVELVVSDSESEDDEGTTTIQLEVRVTVDPEAPPLLAELQLAAVEKAGQALAGEARRLKPLITRRL